MTGPERIAAAFQRARDQDRAALVAYLAAGDPDFDTTVELARAAVAAGADIIELGSPFSDPLADGPVIQAAYTRALAAGATTAGTLECAGRVARGTGAPVVIMVGLNCVLAHGLDRYCADAAAAGASGLLVPDLPVDDADPLRDAAAAAGLGTVFLVAPDTAPDRMERAAAASTGFVYLLRRRGITGSGDAAVDLEGRVARLRDAGTAPVAVGFGVATRADAAKVAGAADGVIVGSVLVQAAYEAGTTGNAAAAVAERVKDITTGLATRPAPFTGGGVA
jgi:tryptophan synthase alpha chain